MFDQQEFVVIFSGAAVEEPNFSEWDERIDCFAFADHMPFEGDRLPLYRVSFVTPHSSGMEYDREKMNVGLPLGEPIRRWIEESRLDRVGMLWSVLRLPSQPRAPQLCVLCEDVEIESSSTSTELALFPEMKNRTTGVLARPGLAKPLSGVRKRHH